MPRPGATPVALSRAHSSRPSGACHGRLCFKKKQPRPLWKAVQPRAVKRLLHKARHSQGEARVHLRKQIFHQRKFPRAAWRHALAISATSDWEAFRTYRRNTREWLPSNFHSMAHASDALHGHLHQQFCSDTSGREAAIAHHAQACQQVTTPFSPFTSTEFGMVLARTKVNKTCGPDGISNAFLLKACADEQAQARSLPFFNHYTVAKVPPTEWRTSALRLLPKVPLPTTWAHTRPIGLLSSLTRLWTRLLLQRLVAATPPFTGGQCCGMPGHQILDACAAAQFLIHKTAEWRGPCLLFKADIEKAFDCIRWPALFEVAWDTFRESRPHEVLALSAAILRSQLTMDFNGSTFHLPQSRGIRQGALRALSCSALRPTPF